MIPRTLALTLPLQLDDEDGRTCCRDDDEDDDDDDDDNEEEDENLRASRRTFRVFLLYIFS